MKKIYIDAGHGGSDSGAVNGTRKEKDDTLRLARLLEIALMGQDVLIKQARINDDNIGLSTRIKQANDWKADYYISLHRNSASPLARGHETWVINTAYQSTILKARAILDAIVKADKLPDRGIKKGAPNYTNFAVNRDTNMASVLLEIGFLSNDLDNKAFDKYIDTYASNLAKALCEVLGVPWKEPTSAMARKMLRQAAGLEESANFKPTATDARKRLRQAAKLEE